ncbi:hypothetical protein HPB51_006550 [Rhipicephalus microplus]|uniref:RRM domain-containing protein n=1 Tax=Rhipicephalus microplus TaxID=6941 RepID=A0A9J6E715_RHIMP|nr:hypothetical protein HPB51_006550 [Rhipicephalus microplus]
MAGEKINVQELRQCESDAEERARSTSQRILRGEYVIIPESSEVGSSTSWQCRAGTSTSASSCDQNQPTSRKREIVVCEPSTSSGKKLRLSDYIPESFVLDYETRDTCTLELSNFTKGVSHVDVDELCWDALDVKHMFKGTRLKCSFARYESEEKAIAAVRYLKDVELKGAPFIIVHCGAKWRHLTQRPEVLQDTLDLHDVPESFRNRDKLAALFPTGQIVRVWPNGSVHAQVKFSSREALIEAVKKPECRTVSGHDMKFALAVAPMRPVAPGNPRTTTDEQRRAEIPNKDENPGNQLRSC